MIDKGVNPVARPACEPILIVPPYVPVMPDNGLDTVSSCDAESPYRRRLIRSQRPLHDPASRLGRP